MPQGTGPQSRPRRETSCRQLGPRFRIGRCTNKKVGDSSMDSLLPSRFKSFAYVPMRDLHVATQSHLVSHSLREIDHLRISCVDVSKFGLAAVCITAITAVSHEPPAPIPPQEIPCALSNEMETKAAVLPIIIIIVMTIGEWPSCFAYQQGLSARATGRNGGKWATGDNLRNHGWGPETFIYASIHCRRCDWLTDWLYDTWDSGSYERKYRMMLNRKTIMKVPW